MPELIGIVAQFDTGPFDAGAKRYLAGLQAVNAAGSQFASSQRGLAAVSQQAGSALSSIGQATSQAKTGFASLSAGTVALGVAVGQLAVQGFNALTSSLEQLGQRAIQTVSDYERLSGAVTTLTARELLHTGAAENMNSALSQAGPIAENTLKWIQQLALASPFSEEDVAVTYRQLQAYGLLGNDAKVLTQNITDLGAGMSLTGSQMNTVAYALGQIHNLGRVTQLDLRQLQNAGVDTNAMLEEMGYSLDDVTAGVVTADDFIKQFSTTISTDFEGAAQRQMNTLQGITASINDLVNIGLRNLLAPAVKELEPELAQLVSGFQTGLLPILKDLGKELAVGTRYLIAHKEEIGQVAKAVAAGAIAFTGFVTVVGGAAAVIFALSNPITATIAAVLALGTAVGGLTAIVTGNLDTISQSFDNVLGGMEGSAQSWGMGLISAFAQGMADAAVYVVDVLMSIGNIISSWLTPGSPPKLLPELDTWGTQAVNVWLEGWTKGDFSLLKDIQSPIESFLRSLPTDIIPKDGLIPTIMGTRSAIQQAIDQMNETGNVGEEAFQKIFTAIGVTDPAIQGYVRSMVQLEKENKAVADAQNRLNQVHEKYATLLKPLNDELDAIGKRRQEVIDQQREAELNKILNDRRAPALAKELAQMELREIQLKRQVATTEQQQSVEENQAQTALEAAQAQRDAVEAQMEAQKAQIEFNTENNRLLQEQLRILEQLNAVSGGSGGPTGGKGGGGVKPPVGGGGGAIFDNFAKKLKDEFDKTTTILDEWKAKWDAWWAILVTPFTPVIDKWNEFNSVVSSTTAAITTTLIVAGAMWTNFWTQHKTSTDLILLSLSLGAQRAYTDLTERVGRLLRAGTILWDGFWSAHSTVSQQVIGVLTTYITTTFEDMVDIVGHLIEGFTAGITGNWDMMSLHLNLATLDMWSIITRTFTLQSEIAGAIVEGLVEVVKGYWTNTKWDEIGGMVIDGIIIGINAGIESLKDAAWNAAKSAFDEAMKFLEAKSPSKKFRDDLARDGMMKGWALGVKSGTKLVVKEVENAGVAIYKAASRVTMPPIGANNIGRDGGPTYTGELTRRPMPPQPIVQGQRMLSHTLYGPPAQLAGDPRQYVFNNGGNTINNGMDLAALDAFIQRSISRAIGATI